MKTKAVRLYGKDDLRLEEFTLPNIREDELLVKVVSDSLCMSSYKALKEGADHKRVPDNAAENPIIIGHEFCGEILEVGAKCTGRFKAGEKFTIQPAMEGTFDAAGYTFPYLGGNTQYAIIPARYLEQDCILPYDGEAYFYGSLTEPVSCVIGAAHANYHTTQGEYTHHMGIRQWGKMALLAGVGPMGLALIDYMLHGERRPSLLVVTDIDEARLERAAEMLSPEEARQHGVELRYCNTGKMESPAKALLEISGGTGFDDVFVFAPVAPVVEQGDAILAYDGCLNFFAGPTDTAFSARFNFYDVHYNATHIAGTSGGNTDDMREALALSIAGKITPAILVTHIGGLNAAVEATRQLPQLPGGKKLIYTHISLPLTAIADFAEKGKTDPLFQKLDELCKKNGGLWCAEAEHHLLKFAPEI